MCSSDLIEAAVIAESARWGDVKTTIKQGVPPRVDRDGKPLTGPFTRDDDWRREFDRIVKDYLPKRSGILLGQLFAQGLLPDLETPQFVREGSVDAPRIVLKSATANASVYYTTDGSDPRLVGGGISPKAVKYSAPIAASVKAAPMKARAMVDDDWSALAATQ